jgi:hypothetical protein
MERVSGAGGSSRKRTNASSGTLRASHDDPVLATLLTTRRTGSARAQGLGGPRRRQWGPAAARAGWCVSGRRVARNRCGGGGRPPQCGMGRTGPGRTSKLPEWSSPSPGDADWARARRAAAAVTVPAIRPPVRQRSHRCGRVRVKAAPAFQQRPPPLSRLYASESAVSAPGSGPPPAVSHRGLVLESRRPEGSARLPRNRHASAAARRPNGAFPAVHGLPQSPSDPGRLGVPGQGSESQDRSRHGSGRLQLRRTAAPGQPWGECATRRHVQVAVGQRSLAVRGAAEGAIRQHAIADALSLSLHRVRDWPGRTCSGSFDRDTVAALDGGKDTRLRSGPSRPVPSRPSPARCPR